VVQWAPAEVQRLRAGGTGHPPATARTEHTGDEPVATAAGRAGAVALFNVGDLPIDTIAWSTLARRGARFMPAAAVPDNETLNAPVLAANLAGTFAVAWLDNSRAVNARSTLHATIGTASGLAPPQAIATGHEQPAEFAAGIDGRGNAVVLWNDYASSGGGRGLFAAFEHPMGRVR